jgi:hypothetical protein
VSVCLKIVPVALPPTLSIGVTIPLFFEIFGVRVLRGIL